jgi:hypothetical protein
MRHAGILLLAVGMVIAVTSGTTTSARDNAKDRRLSATLKGFEEPPAVSSTGSGTFDALISEDGTSISYTLTYEDLEGDVQQAHIHLGQRAVNGGIAAFLCTNLGNAPVGTSPPLCPGPRSGSVSGTIAATDVIGPSGQGLAPGELSEFLRALDRNVTYANVHTAKHTGGEIRGQIDPVK